MKTPEKPKTLSTKFEVGDVVLATPLNGDFANEFQGNITEITKDYIIVTDQDGDAFCCEESQLEFVRYGTAA